jgi:hypothetical protein
MADLRATATGTRVRVCVEGVPTREVWTSISVTGTSKTVLRETKYFLPFRPSARIPPSFLDARSFDATGAPTWHLLFAMEYLHPSGFAGYIGPDRIAVAGDLIEVMLPVQGPVFGYSIEDAPGLTCDEQIAIHEQLQSLIALRPLSRFGRMGGMLGSVVLAAPPPPGCPISFIAL